MASSTLGDRLAQLGGAEPGILPEVPSARSKFIQMGLVLLSTAGLAVVSMAFALTDGLKVQWWFAIPLGVGWGFIILNLDRMLILNMRPGNSLWRTAGMLLPRIGMAALLGIVISTPIVLRVFQNEIATNETVVNAQAANSLGQTRAKSPTSTALTQVEAKIGTDEGILAGTVPGLTAANVAAGNGQLAAAQSNLADKRHVATDAYDKMTCELDGSNCQGASGRSGDGPRYQSLNRLYQIAAADLADAQTAVQTAQAAVDKANREVAASNTVTVAAAQTQAKTELPALYANRTVLQKQINGVMTQDSVVQASNTGLLAQIEALDRIGSTSPAANEAHWAVAGLFFMIELLPVLVKSLTSLGSPSLYDRISDLADESTYDDAVQRRRNHRRRMETDSQKHREFEDDMHTAEKAPRIKVNTLVDNEMEKILDVVLQQWSTQVMKTLHNGEPSSAEISGVGEDQANHSLSGGMQGRVGASKGAGTQPKGNSSARVEAVNAMTPTAPSQVAVEVDGSMSPGHGVDGEAGQPDPAVPVAAGRIRVQLGLPFVREL